MTYSPRDWGSHPPVIHPDYKSTRLRGTTKPVGTSFFIADHVSPVIEMFDLALGGTGRFRPGVDLRADLASRLRPNLRQTRRKHLEGTAARTVHQSLLGRFRERHQD